MVPTDEVFEHRKIYLDADIETGETEPGAAGAPQNNELGMAPPAELSDDNN